MHRDDHRTSAPQVLITNPRSLAITPRLLCIRDAPAQAGMDRNTFNTELRADLTDGPRGRQTIVFDRIELHARIDDYTARNGHRRQASRLEDDLVITGPEATQRPPCRAPPQRGLFDEDVAMAHDKNSGRAAPRFVAFAGGDYK